MTSTADTDEHPEVADISALTEGVLPPAQARLLREHLAGCALCADVQTSLEEIRALLGTLPGPARMPAEIAGRIDAALAAEALLDATVSRPEEAEPADVSRETTAEPAGVSRETTAGGTERPPGHARSATGPGRQAPSHGGRPRRRRRWQTALLSTACAAAVLGAGTFFLQHSSDEGSSQSGTTTTARPHSQELTASDLAGEVRELLTSASKKSVPAPSDEVGAQTSPNAPLDTQPGPSVPSCVQQGTQRPETPLAVKKDTFGGKPAYLVLLPHPGDDATVDAFVIDAACVRESPSPPGTVLLQHSFPRA